MKQIGTELKNTDLFLKREDYYKNLFRKITSSGDKIKLGGGKIALEKHKAKGKLTARERIAKLVDNEKEFF